MQNSLIQKYMYSGNKTSYVIWLLKVLMHILDKLEMCPK